MPKSGALTENCLLHVGSNTYLNTWSPADGIVWESFGGVALLDLSIYSLTLLPVCFLLAAEMWALIFLLLPPCLSLAALSSHHGRLLPLPEPEAKVNSFFHKLPFFFFLSQAIDTNLETWTQSSEKEALKHDKAMPFARRGSTQCFWA